VSCNWHTRSSRLAERLSKAPRSESQLNLSPILAKLGKSEKAFLHAALAIADDQWKTKPEKDEWSAAELVSHLIVVERGVVGTASRVSAKAPKHFGAWRRVHIPLWMVEARVVKLKSPIPFDPTMIEGKEKMLGDLRKTRREALAFLEGTKGRDLSAYRWKHPFLGNLNLYEWFEMIAAHEARHTKQMKDIGSKLRKVV
jgi:DinB superfamily